MARFTFRPRSGAQPQDRVKGRRRCVRCDAESELGISYCREHALAVRPRKNSHLDHWQQAQGIVQPPAIVRNSSIYRCVHCGVLAEKGIRYCRKHALEVKPREGSRLDVWLKANGIVR